MEYVSLGSLTNRKIGYGIVQPGKNIKHGIPVIKVNNLISGLRNLDDLEKTSEENDKKYRRTKLSGGELIISVVGTVGKTAIVPKSFVGCNLVRATALIDIIDPILTAFVKYYIDSPQGKNYILENLNTTVQPTLNIKSLIDMPIPKLDRNFVIKIVSILSSLDDKIELNRRINANLEEQSQALFKSWFIDFEPFKDGKFVDSELGMIPEGLELKFIKDIPHKIESGRRPKGGATLNGVPSIGAENIKGLGLYDYSKTKYIPNDFASTTVKGKINGYELLIYKDGGKPGYFIPNYTIFGDGFPFKEMFINEHVFKLDLFDRGYNAFAYFYMQTPYIMNQLNSIGGKAAIPGINTKDVESLPIFSGDNKYVQEFGIKVLLMIKQILHNCKESARLSALRDTLLPKLMSGEIEVES